MVAGGVSHSNHVDRIFLQEVDDLVGKAIQESPTQLVFLVTDLELAGVSTDGFQKPINLLEESGSQAVTADFVPLCSLQKVCLCLGTYDQGGVHLRRRA